MFTVKRSSNPPHCFCYQGIFCRRTVNVKVAHSIRNYHACEEVIMMAYCCFCLLLIVLFYISYAYRQG